LENRQHLTGIAIDRFSTGAALSSSFNLPYV
jgi:hypothetical protein